MINLQVNDSNPDDKCTENLSVDQEEDNAQNVNQLTTSKAKKFMADS